MHHHYFTLRSFQYLPSADRTLFTSVCSCGLAEVNELDGRWKVDGRELRLVEGLAR